MDKQALRREIATKKQQYSAPEFLEWSEIIRQKIESLPLFQQASSVLLYHSLPDEVQTHSMLRHWQKNKRCFLPQIQGDHLVVREYEGNESLTRGQMNILEPTGRVCSDYGQIEVVIVPGVAFDLEGNRLGRGKGYYDKLLPLLSAPAIGICFGFQLVEKVPAEAHDVKMTRVITEE